MSAWGNQDFKASPGTVDISGLTVSNTAGVPTFFANNFSVGDVISFGTDGGKGSAVIKSIAGEGTLTIVSNTELTVGTATALVYAVSEKPIAVVDSDTNTNANNVYGVSQAEMLGAGGAGVGTITVTAAGSGFTARPTVTFVSAAGIGAQANTTAKVVSIAVANGGAGFTNGAVIQIGGGTGTTANATVVTNNNSTAVNSLVIINAGSYTVLPTLTNNIPSNFIGSGLRTNLSIGLNTVTVNASGSGYRSTDTVTIGGAGGTGATATINFTGALAQGGDAPRLAHAGWVKIGQSYTDANGNTRQKSEVLVAMSTITGDNNDDDAGDVQLPE